MEMKEFKKIEDCKEWLKNNDVNKLDEYNQNILFYQDDFEIIKYLIENTNININELNCINQNILFYPNFFETIKYLIENTNIDIENFLNNDNSIENDHYNYIKSFYEARELNKITSIKKDVKKLNKI